MAISDKVATEGVTNRIVDRADDLVILEAAKKLGLSYKLTSETSYGVLFFASELNKVDEQTK